MVMATVPATSALMPPPAPLEALPLQASQEPRPLEGWTIALGAPHPDFPWDAEVAGGFGEAERALVALGARLVAAPVWSVDWDDLTTVLFTEMCACCRADTRVAR